MMFSLEDLVDCLTAEMELKGLLRVLATRYLLEHPGAHIVTEQEAESLKDYAIACRYMTGSVEVQLHHLAKQSYEAPLRLVEPDDTEQTIEQFFEKYPQEFNDDE